MIHQLARGDEGHNACEDVQMIERTDKQVQPATETIELVLKEFLAEAQARLKPQTCGQYQTIIELFQDFMNGYVYAELDEGDRELFERFSDTESEAPREFCQIFGPGKIPENVDEFLNYFMVRKVTSDEALRQTAATVMKELDDWLEENDWIHPPQTESSAKSGEIASKTPDELAAMLMKYVDEMDSDGDYQEIVEDYFSIESIESELINLSDLSGEEGIPVPVSQEISDACQVGWTIAGAAAKTSDGWRIIQVWNVYPHE